MYPLTAFLLLIVLLLVASPSQCQLPSPNYWWCAFRGGGNYTANSTFQSNIVTLLSNLSSTTPHTSGFLTSTSGSGRDLVHGLALCRGDTTLSSCSSCLNFASSDLPQLCPYNKSAAVWYDLCFMRYSNTSFEATITTGNRSRVYMRNAANISTSSASADASRYNQSILWALNLLREYAVTNATSPKLFAVGKMPIYGLGGYDTLYGLVQCTRDISPDDCDRCLKWIFGYLDNCCPGPAIGGRVLSSNCDFRYEVGTFYNWSRELLLPPFGAVEPVQPPAPAPKPPAPIGGKKNSTIIILAIAIPVGIAALGSLAFCIYLRRKTTKTKKYGRFQDITAVESLLFDLTTVRNATNNFSLSNKLGEGGFGSVYKGVLPDGQEIAVKKLSRTSLQGLEQIKNEVVLLAKLQHKNLVQILGVCFEEDERMLIFEYVENKSLDTMLFDPIRNKRLDWKTRYRIILGIARGLLYLHEESQIIIIHRDLKASNILLDGELNPKISDFGTARLFGGDQTQQCTNTIVGTFGYMPPEYVMRGQFSKKTDVFSFGVLILEIVTGRTDNNLYPDSENSEDLSSFVWKHWSGDSISELVDSSLEKNYQPDEVLRCIQIGLLCIQELPNDRPTMASIFLMLNNQTTSIQLPMEPAFLGGYRKMYSISEATSSSKQSDTKSPVFSANQVSITELEPR